MNQSLMSKQSDGVRRLPATWVDRLFEKMEDRYGSLWSQRYAGIPQERMMNTWAEDLGDLTRQQLINGMNACREHRFPPTLPDFRMLCVQLPIDPYTAYMEAVEQHGVRLRSGRDTWSHPAVFWTANTFSDFELRNSSWRSFEKVWTKRLTDEIAKGSWNVIPSFHLGIESPETIAVSDEQAMENFRKVQEVISNVAKKTSMVGV